MLNWPHDSSYRRAVCLIWLQWHQSVFIASKGLIHYNAKMASWFIISKGLIPYHAKMTSWFIMAKGLIPYHAKMVSLFIAPNGLLHYHAKIALWFIVPKGCMPYHAKMASCISYQRRVLWVIMLNGPHDSSHQCIPSPDSVYLGQ